MSVREALNQLDSTYPETSLHIDWHFVQYLASSGAAARAQYHGVHYAPSVIFDGVNEIMGGLADPYSVYEPAFLGRRAVLSQLTVDAVVAFDEATRSGSTTVTVRVSPGEELADVSSTRIRCAIHESGIGFLGTVWDHIGRAIVLDVPLIARHGGDVQVETATFALEDPNPPSWATPWGPAANFGAVVFVQRDTDHEILNAARATTPPASIEPASWGRIKASFR